MIKSYFEVVNVDKECTDIDFYIDMQNGNQWFYRVFLDKTTNEVIECDPRFAQTKNDDFEECINLPLDVYKELQRKMPIIKSALFNLY